ncbi:Long-chain base-1-phosphate phosphatase [Linderina macrospora]|uniref:Long-chain base-1-phosphate phosphatase n=1 Tax=Linderina macrospora TaxID=4868 RepID=A0ACC1JDK5_9FUNG|nr:Long-chain base-1-phosphate phosphatase [Linderina macrospora]
MAPRFQLDEDDANIRSIAVQPQVPEYAYGQVYSQRRMAIRQWMIQQVEWETPMLASIQKRLRAPLLDKFFVLTGMLGNHAFFFLALPFLHILGLGPFARGVSNVVLLSVYLSGLAKDYVSAPRPASPPLVHITRSPAHTFEYGFPSSHTTYVVGTIMYITWFMYNVWNVHVLWIGVLWVFGASIVFGRIYCGLHSFVDIAGGFLVGTVEALVLIACNDALDSLMLSWTGPLYICGALYLALSTIPRSLEMCPCCVDTFCALSVIAGIYVGAWAYALLPSHIGNTDPAYIAWSTSLTLTQNVLRGVVCIGAIVAWKATSKPVAIKLVKAFIVEENEAPVGFDSEATTDVEPSQDIQESASKGHANAMRYVLPSKRDIQKGRYGTYSLMCHAEDIARVPIYSGIGFIVAFIAPVLFYYLGLAPV